MPEEGKFHAPSALHPRTESLLCTEYEARRALEPVWKQWTRDRRFAPTGNLTSIPRFHSHCTAELFRLLRRVKANNCAVQKEIIRIISLCSYIEFGSTAIRANNYAVQKEIIRIISLCSYIDFGSTAITRRP